VVNACLARDRFEIEFSTLETIAALPLVEKTGWTPGSLYMLRAFRAGSGFSSSSLSSMGA
jgi:hypothetical protein